MLLYLLQSARETLRFFTESLQEFLFDIVDDTILANLINKPGGFQVIDGFRRTLIIKNKIANCLDEEIVPCLQVPQVIQLFPEFEKELCLILFHLSIGVNYIAQGDNIISSDAATCNDCFPYIF